MISQIPDALGVLMAYLWRDPRGYLFQVKERRPHLYVTGPSAAVVPFRGTNEQLVSATDPDRLN